MFGEGENERAGTSEASRKCMENDVSSTGMRVLLL